MGLARRFPMDDAGLTRRAFLEMLGVTGATLASAPLLSACLAQGIERGELALSPEAEAAMTRILDAMVPWEPPGEGTASSAGAVEAGALGALELRHYLLAAHNLGFIRLDMKLDALLHGVDTLIAFVVVESANLHATLKFGLPFLDLEPEQQEELLADRFSDPVTAPLYELVRAAALVAFLAAPTSDVGYEVIGMGRYLDREDGLHNAGYPASEYSSGTAPPPGDEVLVDGDIP
jgi:hypothetical protein